MITLAVTAEGADELVFLVLVLGHQADFGAQLGLGGADGLAGGLFRGIKLIEPTPGLAQKPALRWLPDPLLGRDYANKTILLYYTGVTRLATGSSVMVPGSTTLMPNCATSSRSASE